MSTGTVMLVVFLAAVALFCRLRWLAAEHERKYWKRQALDYAKLYHATLKRLPAQPVRVIPPPCWN